jgi:4-hydroxythreonine-4-phosphate dehydrogenase
LLLDVLSRGAGERECTPVVVAERRALEAHASGRAGADIGRFEIFEHLTAADLESLDRGRVALVEPPAKERRVVPGEPTAEDARSALQALRLGVELVRSGPGDALLTLPVSKASIAEHAQPRFVGHTDYLAEDAGLELYGTDYLMCFLAGDLQVALLTTHVPLREAIDSIGREAILAALSCLHRHAGGRIAVAGLNPHAGEGGLLGLDEEIEIRPAIGDARGRGIDVHGPFSADSLFARCRRGEFDWVLALYHDQGLVAVKTAAYGTAMNWTLGLPYLRTSVDHGTAFDLAGRGEADSEPLRRALESTLALLRGDLPRRSRRRRTPRGEER